MNKNLYEGMELTEWQRQFKVMWDYWLKQSCNQVYDFTHRLYHCSAEVTMYRDYVLLTSYNTLVAIYHIPSKCVLIRGRYSATTDQHVSKFLRWLRHYEYPVVYVLQDYVKSCGEIGYNYYEMMAYRNYKRNGVMLVDRDNNKFAVWRLPVYPA